MPLPAVDLATKQSGQTWLLPLYSYSLSQISGELDVGLGTLQKWRQALVDNGHKFEMISSKIIVSPPRKSLQPPLQRLSC
jgi:hypothetical protein